MIRERELCIGYLSEFYSNEESNVIENNIWDFCNDNIDKYKIKSRSYLLALKRKTIDKTYLFNNINKLSIKDLHPNKWNPYKELEEYESKKKELSVTDVFKCSRCKGNKTCYEERQTRSADESATCFITCLLCNYKWKQ